jgi:hypothetical protein
MSLQFSIYDIRFLSNVHGNGNSYLLPEDLTESDAEFVRKLINLCFMLISIDPKNIILPNAALSAGAGLRLVRHALRRYTLEDDKYRNHKNIGNAKDLILGFQL